MIIVILLLLHTWGILGALWFLYYTGRRKHWHLSTAGKFAVLLASGPFVFVIGCFVYVLYVLHVVR